MPSTADAPDPRSAAASLHRDAFVVDVHVHGPRFVPQPFRAAYRLVNHRTMPADEELDDLRAAGVDLAVAKAVGDPVVTRWYRASPWEAVRAQLEQVRRDARAAAIRVVDGTAGVAEARADGVPAIVLGVEGADAIGDDLDKVDGLYELGVRVVVPVHLGDNQIGTTCLPWQGYITPLAGGLASRRRRTGLSPFGRRVVDRMHGLGIVVDVSHADRDTLHAIVDGARAPVIASHSGARACHDFERYLSDDEARSVAGTGGVIGLWPYFHRGHGVRDMAELVGHARHLCELVGPEHLCIGTDMNGVPGAMAGYRGEIDLPHVTHALIESGLTDDEVRGILGLNFLRVLGQVERAASVRPA